MRSNIAGSAILTVVSGLVAFGPANAASIFQVTTTQAVTQDIITLQGHPGYRDPNPFLSDPYIFFDEHIRILTEEIDVFDPTQIPSSPTDVPVSEDYNVISTGSVTGTWTFDADFLLGIDTGLVSTGEEDTQFLGRRRGVSTFRAVSDGRNVGSLVTTSTAVYALNDIVAGVGGERLDVIALVAEEAPQLHIDTDGMVLFLAGAENWFETSVGAIPDFNEVLVSSLAFEQIVRSDDGDELFEEIIESEADTYPLRFSGFGAADGSSQSAPLLPTTATVGATGGPSFSFDVSSAGTGFVFVDPEIAVGYTYVLENGGTVAKFQAPTLSAVNDPDGYTLVLPDGTSFSLLPGEVLDFVAEGYTNVTTFEVLGISEALMLDPDNITTFVAGFMFSGTGSTSNLTQTAIVVDTDAAVPLPPAAALMLAGLGGLGVLSRRKRRVA
ncbi:hypothetical protein [Meridianimarinicoccus aquatilis]|uniref:VPLPA-CTERM sorting domain-containing protein n=1 Tax=Meridianimarinicoccus aquatilis TaxID=2552766 RepID=A0A4R6AWH7_9RHOB|nr:hypothetical protein [Fluviibacterium aquatile]TDL89071.1 hypothetical protein E2L05_08185 [Fluviibacterium aquatile]